MYFTLYGYNPVSMALNLLRDLKLVRLNLLSRCFCSLITFVGSIHQASSASDLHFPDHWGYYREYISLHGYLFDVNQWRIQGGLLNFVIMTTVVDAQRDILLAVQGSNVWSGQQVQSYNSAAIAWGALGKPLYATGTRYGVSLTVVKSVS